MFREVAKREIRVADCITRVADLERRVFMEEGRHPGILTNNQKNKVSSVEQSGESIWSSQVRLIAAFGNERPVD